MWVTNACQPYNHSSVRLYCAPGAILFAGPTEPSSMADTFVVIGGDAAGMSAASKAKREHPEMDVVVFEKGEWVSYGACGLPYYVKGEIEDIQDIIAVPKERFVE